MYQQLQSTQKNERLLHPSDFDIPEIRPLVPIFRSMRSTAKAAAGRSRPSLATKKLHSGFVPRFSALVAKMVGIMGNSRRTVQDVLRSVFVILINQSGLQTILDRISNPKTFKELEDGILISDGYSAYRAWITEELWCLTQEREQPWVLPFLSGCGGTSLRYYDASALLISPG